MTGWVQETRKDMKRNTANGTMDMNNVSDADETEKKTNEVAIETEVSFVNKAHAS